MLKEDTCGADDGSNRSSSEAEDHEYEVSTRNTAQVSTCGLHSVESPTNIHMENNSDVHIGSRLHYNAPVTINQYVNVLGKSDATQNGILHEAVKAPIYGRDTSENISQVTLIGPNEKGQGVSNDGSRHCDGAATNCNKGISFFLHHRIYLGILAVSLLLMVILISVIVHFSSRNEDDLPKHTFYPPPNDPEPDPNATLPGGHHIYSKEDWNGAPARYERQLQHPTPFVVISHTASPACFSYTVCAAQMRNFQDLHMGSDLNLPDIGYSFVVGGDGNVYEGRGWDVTNMHTRFVTRCNIGISFIGNFVSDTPTNGQIEAVQELIKFGVKMGKIDENYKLVAMNETYNTLSPGLVLYGIISKWPHFWKATREDIGICPFRV